MDKNQHLSAGVEGLRSLMVQVVELVELQRTQPPSSARVAGPDELEQPRPSSLRRDERVATPPQFGETAPADPAPSEEAAGVLVAAPSLHPNLGAAVEASDASLR